MLRSCLTWAPVSAMGSRFLCYGAPRDGALIYVSCPTIAQEWRDVGRVCPVQKECGCRVGEQRGLQADVYDGRKRSMDGSKRPAPMQ